MYQILSNSQHLAFLGANINFIPCFVLSEMARRQNNPPSPIDNEADRALISPENIRLVTHNNEYVDLNHFVVQDAVVLEILKVHPIAYVMQTTVNVPMLYVQ